MIEAIRFRLTDAAKKVGHIELLADGEWKSGKDCTLNFILTRFPDIEIVV